MTDNRSSNGQDEEKTLAYSCAEAKAADSKPTTDDTSSGGHNGNIVDWDSPNDPDDPMNWPGTRKWTMIGILSAIAFNQWVLIWAT